MSDEPIRLLDDPALSGALRGDLEQAASAQVSGLDVHAGLTGLQTSIASGSAAVGKAGLGLGAKVVIALVVAGGAVAVWAGTRPAAEPPMVAVAPSTTVPTISKPAMAPKSEPDPVVVPPAPAPAPVPVPELAAEPAPDKPHTRAKRPGKRPDKAAPEPGFLREARQVAQARRLLAQSPARALAITESLESEFPRGQLVEERRALAIRALAALGRDAEASRRATRFLARYGKGPHAAAVRKAIGGAD